MLRVASEAGLDGQLLHGDIALVHRGQLRRQIAHVQRVQAAGIDVDGHLHAAAGRKVGDVAVVADVAVEAERPVGLHGLQYV